MLSPNKSGTELSYDVWNESVGRYCFNPKNEGNLVRLAVDPLVLQRAAAEGPRRHHFASPEAAADDFKAAVTCCINESGWEISETHCGKYPHGLAKLALQVLAVFGISADDEGGSSYWAALWDALGREVKRRGIEPEDLNLSMHQRNWAALAHWANDLNKGRLGWMPEPDPDAGGRKHVRLPLTHGLLRKEDIQGLSRFFTRISLTPGKDVEPDDLITDLKYYATDTTVFRGAHARRVLQDERLPLAANQIANAACQWDGQRVDLAKTRGQAVRLWLSVRTAGSARIAGGLLQLDPRGTGTDVAGITLTNMLGRGAVQRHRSPVVYCPLADRLVVAVQSLIDGRYVESRYLRPGDQCAIVRPASGDSPRFERELRRIATAERLNVYGKGTDGVPEGWAVYRLRIRESVREFDIPDELNRRVKIGGVRVSACGGLRVRGAWLEGAGPTIAIRGGEAAQVIVDGQEYPVTDGCVHPEKCRALSELGEHEAWLPGHHQERVRFRVIKPKPVKFSSLVVEAGWAWEQTPKWPRRVEGSNNSSQGTVRGPVIEGEWPPVRAANAGFHAAEQAAVRLATVLRNPAAAGGPAALAALKAANENHPNLLVRQLARALSADVGARLG